MGWSEERVERLKSLWAEGLSASQISRVIGGCLSRNAVIGKVHRLGLAGRATPARSDRPRGGIPRIARVAPPPEPPPILEPPLEIEGKLVTLETLEPSRMCHWPIGDPADNAFHFCGRKPKGGSPYCDVHHLVAHQPRSERFLRKHEREVA